MELLYPVIILNEIQFPTESIREMIHKVQEKKKEHQLEKQNELELAIQKEREEREFQSKIAESINSERDRLKSKQIQILEIEKLLSFYQSLTNSLVTQLYLQFKPYDELNKLLNSPNSVPNIKIKNFKCRFDLPKYLTYLKGELKENLNQINNSFNFLYGNSKLVDQINKCLVYRY